MLKWVGNRHPGCLRRWTKRRSGRHQRAVDPGRALIHVPVEQACVGAHRNAEIFAIEIMFAERAALLLQKFGSRIALGSQRLLLAAAMTGHHLSQTVQNGSVRLHAVDSMANRACGRRARIGRNALIGSVGEPGGLVGDDPAIDRQAPD